MTASTLRLLFWKDLRQHRVALMGAALLLCAPFIIAGVHGARSDGGLDSVDRVADLATVASFWALMLTLFTGAIMGGVSFASERQDGSADFLQMMVPDRRVVLASRVLFAGAVLLSTAGVTALAILLLEMRRDAMGDDSETMRILTVVGCLIACVFGTSWAASSRLKSPTISAALGIGATALVGVGIASGASMVDLAGDDVPRAMSIVAGLVGATGFIGGCVLYLRRREP